MPEPDWSAGWIGVAEPERPPKGERPAYWLRGVVEVAATPGARLLVTALGIYELFLNGVRIGDEELAPGFTQYRHRVQYQSYDPVGALRKGRNVLAVLLADGWFRGQVGLPRAGDQFGTELALRLQLEAPSAAGWSVIAQTGGDDVGAPDWRTSPSHITRADLIGGQSEDRRLVEPAIHDPSFDDRGWNTAVARDVKISVVRPIAPPVRRVQELRPVSLTPVAGPTDAGHLDAGHLDAGHPDAGPTNAGPTNAVIVDLGQNINGWIRLSSLGPAGTRITLRHGEHLDAGGDLDTAHLDVSVPIFPDPLPLGQVDDVVSAGLAGDMFEPRFTTHGFRYVRIEGHPGPLDLADVTGVVVHSDLRRTGWFSCSDERINRLNQAVVWSLRGNLCAVPTDCPQRERAGWTGDWQIFAPTAAYLYDVLEFTRSWLRDVALDQRADGCVANISPCPPGEGFEGPVGGLNGSAGWGDVVVSAPWDLYQAYGDTALLRENWAAAGAWLDYAARSAADGRHPTRAAHRPVPEAHEKYLWDSGFHWGEWLEPGMDLSDFGAFAGADKSEVATAYLHRSAATAVLIGELLGADTATVERFRELAEGTRTAWQAEFIRPDGTLVVASQASHVRALAFDLVPDELRPRVAAQLVELIGQAGGHLSTGFLSTGLLLPTLADAGHLDTAYALLLSGSEPSWLTMIDRGATTLWERWNGIDADGVAHESLNHYSKGAVASFLHRHLAGLQATSPGYRTFSVNPQPGGGLTWAQAALECPYGLIEVSWRREGAAIQVDVTVPAGTRAQVSLPDGRTADIGPGRHSWPTNSATMLSL